MSAAPFVMLHLGLGSFHRAHQAVYLHALQQLGDTSWVLAGGNLRHDTPELIAALQAQGGAYTLETVAPDGDARYERITSIRRVYAHEPSLAALIDAAASPATRIISFTVTEAGYYLDAKNRLDFGFADLVADHATAKEQRPGSTIYGALTAMLRERMRRGGGAVTLLNCDNLRHNGDRSRSGLLQFIEGLDEPGLRAWAAA
jgi:D-arabinitol 4-dehydrogenase